MTRTRRQGLPVLDADGRLAGMFTTQDIQTARGAMVGEACSRAVEVAYPDETLHAALERMSRMDVGRLPVVERGDPRRVIGLLRRSDVIRAYDLALKRRAAQRHRESALRLDAFTPSRARVLELEIAPGASADGRCLSELSLPAGCVVASLRRSHEVIVLRGTTLLRAGDVLVVTVDSPESEQAVRRAVNSVDG